MERINFIGRAAESEESLKGVTASYEKMLEIAKDRNNPDDFMADIVKHEIPKNEEEIRFINKSAGYINQEIKLLGVDMAIKVDPESIFFVDKEFNFGEKSSRGVYYRIPGVVACQKNPDAIKKFDFYCSILHEMIHLATIQKFHLVAFANENKKVKRYRIGYKCDKSGLSALNESVTDMVLSDIVTRHWKEMKDEFNFDKKEIDDSVLSYSDYVYIVNIIINQLSQKSGKEPEVIEEQFKKGLFSGKMLHLKEIENLYGKKSLRVLASLNKDNLIQVKEYFSSTDQKNKKKLLEEILKSNSTDTK